MTTMECGVPYDKVDVEAIREGFDLAYPDVRKAQKKRKEPNEPLDIGVSILPDTKGTTLYWDEYADWG